MTSDDMEIEELDVVAPLADVPGTPIRAGTQGTVLVKGNNGSAAAASLLIEFADNFGVTIAEVWMTTSDVHLVWSAPTGKFVINAAMAAAAQAAHRRLYALHRPQRVAAVADALAGPFPLDEAAVIAAIEEGTADVAAGRYISLKDFRAQIDAEDAAAAAKIGA